MGSSATQRLLQMLELFDHSFDGLGFCLSEERDLLSQWRGYAADATGVCIGFSRDYLAWLSDSSSDPSNPKVSLKQVRYDPVLHEAEVEPTYLEAKRLINEGAFNLSGVRLLLDTRTDEEIEEDRKKNSRALTSLSFALLNLFPKLYLLKSPAFKEEREWRLLSHLIQGIEDDCSYRVKDDRIIPFRTVQLHEIPRKPIVEVLLGPKHTTPVRMVEQFLKRHGFDDVRVLRSEGTYR